MLDSCASIKLSEMCVRAYIVLGRTQPVSARTQVVGAALSQWEYLASSYVEGQLKVLGTK